MLSTNMLISDATANTEKHERNKPRFKICFEYIKYPYKTDHKTEMKIARENAIIIVAVDIYFSYCIFFVMNI